MLALASLFIAAFGVALGRAEFRAPEPSTLLLDRHGRFLAELGEVQGAGFGYWPIDIVPERVAAATLAIEDRRFWWHIGVDPIAVARAIGQNLSAGRRERLGMIAPSHPNSSHGGA